MMKLGIHSKFLSTVNAIGCVAVACGFRQCHNYLFFSTMHSEHLSIVFLARLSPMELCVAYVGMGPSVLFHYNMTTTL